MNRVPLDPAAAPSARQGDPALKLGLPLGRREYRIIFREMVRAESQTGLSPGRERRLADYAATLGIGAIDAERLISQVRQERAATTGAPAQDVRRPCPGTEPARRWASHEKVGMLIAGLMGCAWLVARLL
jgi:hypothetical protein